MAAFRTGGAPGESDRTARTAATAADLPDLLPVWAPTGPACAAQVRVPLVLAHHDAVDLRALARPLGTAPQPGSRLCHRRQITDPLEREPCSADRREARPRLSGRGRSHRVRLQARMERETRPVLAATPPARREAPREGLEAFRAAAPSILAREAATAVGEAAVPGREPAADEARGGGSGRRPDWDTLPRAADPLDAQGSVTR
ncbi:MarR family transcriptional regulator [Streptomyces sp. NPDC052301]|uniref:MarR family transcriptional regulator n=1 Tax=Streptomyces sp. NPDC052301 TaxID=3365687 RepID=UPI0037D46454